jgi:8-oxo-dGTP diphosphatase
VAKKRAPGSARAGHRAPQRYDASAYPAFAVTVDIVIFTIVDDALTVLLVRRGGDPYKGSWALPGGFKRPDETLDEAAARELREETGVGDAAHLVQLGAYGDPGRDPRTDVVTVAYLAVLRDVGEPKAATDVTATALRPVADVVSGRLELAFDHARIVRDAVERAHRDLETTSLATAFVGPDFTLSELRRVFEAVWDTQFDPANFRRKLLSEPDWVEPTGRRAKPGAEGGKPPELYRTVAAWSLGAPVRRPRKPSS